MREMKDSGIPWIGQIPADWSIVKIKAGVHKVGSGKTPSGGATTYADEGVLFLRSQNIYDTGLELSNPTYITPEVDEEMKGTRVFPNDVLLNITGGSIGRCCIFPKSLKTANVNQHVSIIRVNQDVFLPEYMHYYWVSPLGSLAIDLYQTGGNREGMSADAIKNTPIILIPLDEQRRICRVLDDECSKIDSVLAKIRTSIEEYKKLKQAIITQAVTKGVRGDRPMKESGIGGIDKIPADWSTYKFSHIASVKCNLVPPQEYLDYPQVSPENIEKGSGKLLACKTVRDSGVISGNHLFFEGQILYSKIRPKLNKVCIAPFSGLCSADMYPIETKSNTKFIVYYMRSDAFFNQVAMITEDRVKMPKINQNELGAILIAIPPDKSEQAEIAEYLDQSCSEIDELISKKEQLAFELESYKKSLIYEYVTGKKEVQQKQQVKEMVIYPFFPAVFQTTNPRFAQAILMSKVLDSCKVKMGRVKLEKIMFVLQSSIGFDFDTEYVREAAGPLDKSLYTCEGIISKRNKWFIIHQSKGGVSYRPTENVDKYKKYYDQYFSEYKDAINHVIDIFEKFDGDQAEVIATLYGAWNDLIIDKRDYTDHDIVDEVLNHWHPKKRRFPEDMWLRAIQKMRELDLVPHGYGRHTVIKQN